MDGKDRVVNNEGIPVVECMHAVSLENLVGECTAASPGG